MAVRTRLLPIIFAGLVMLSGCGADPSAVVGPGSTAGLESVELVGGGNLDLSRAVRDKPVVLWFWAPG